MIIRIKISVRTIYSSFILSLSHQLESQHLVDYKSDVSSPHSLSDCIWCICDRQTFSSWTFSFRTTSFSDIQLYGTSSYRTSSSKGHPAFRTSSFWDIQLPDIQLYRTSSFSDIQLLGHSATGHPALTDIQLFGHPALWDIQLPDIQL